MRKGGFISPVKRTSPMGCGRSPRKFFKMKGGLISLIRAKYLQRIAFTVLSLLLCAVFSGGCDFDVDKIFDVIGVKTPSNEELFDLYMDELFADWVSQDSISMNYYLADPERMGVERPEPTYGVVTTLELARQEREETGELAERIGSFKYDSLREDQKVAYDIIKRNITLYEILEREDKFAYYTGYIHPLTGIQVQLPILLAEFNFYTAEDIERYLELLGDTCRYFDEIIEFERERSRHGFFMSDDNVDSVTEQIESYLENRDDNLLITVFDDKIDEYEGLSAGQRVSLKQRNRQLVLDNVLVAYDNLLTAMKELRGVGVHNGGLAGLPDGREYAHASLCLRVGTDRSPEELDTLLEDWKNQVLMDIMDILSTNVEIYGKLMGDTIGEIEEGSPKSYISALQKSMREDFPPIEPTRHVVLEVHESLQEHTSPAFYLTPAVDNFDDNVIYVNPASIDDNLYLFTTLAHESYPGHLYQTVYFLQQSPHPVRVLLSNTGYSEGWATYVEMISYSYTELSAVEAELMWNLRFYDLLVQSQIDFGVNVLGWDIEKVEQVFNELNITDTEIIESVYNMVTGVPLHSVTYALGFIELSELHDEAEAALQDDFDLADFHRFVLDIGPAPFPLIRTHMDEWIEARLPGALQPAA